MISEYVLANYIFPILIIVGKILTVTIPLILCVAYLTYFERKIIAAMQLRKGPNVVGPLGLFQPFADAIKLMFKEVIIPNKANKITFIIAPIITFTLSLIGWAVIPTSANFVIADINLGVLYLLAVSSLEVYGVIIAGWSSNNNYAFLGAIRSSAQMISYEVSIGLVIITVLLATGTLNLNEIVIAQKSMHWSVKLMLFPMMVIFFISILAETNRHPFDLPEAESELVAGYNVEYSSMSFALFFLGEYANMILTSAMLVILFLGGWLAPIDCYYFNLVPGFLWFALKVSAVLFCFIWVRAAFPRYRYDQLMRLGWKVFLPFTLFWVVLVASYLKFNNLLPII